MRLVFLYLEIIFVKKGCEMKKICLIICAFIVFVGLNLSYSTPLFYTKGQEIEVYLGSASSLAKIERVDFYEFLTLNQVMGESVEYQAQDFCLQEFLDRYNAKLVFSENTSQGQSYFAYSKKIRYKKTINGKLVNLQVFVSNQRVKVGSPIIFGSF